MDTVYSDIYLDVYNVDSEPPVVKTSRDDNSVRIIRAYLTDRSENFSVSSTDTIMLWGKKSDGTPANCFGEYFVIDEVTEETPDGRNGALVGIYSSFTDVVGDVECQFVITEDGSAQDPVVIRTQKFIIRVFDNVDHEFVSEIPGL